MIVFAPATTAAITVLSPTEPAANTAMLDPADGRAAGAGEVERDEGPRRPTSGRSHWGRPNTVKAYLHNVMHKLDAPNRAQVTTRARAHGLL